MSIESKSILDIFARNVKKEEMSLEYLKKN